MDSFSIIIPTYRRPQSALACLESLLELDYPGELFEVVLVEDGEGPEPLRDEDLERFREPLRLKVIRQENAGPAAARNRGAEEATGTYLAFTDDDCRPNPDWLRKLAEQFELTPDAVVGGQTKNGIARRVCSEASQILLDYIVGYFLAKGHPFFASNNFALSREGFLRVGGFDRKFAGAGGEDREFCARCVRQGLEFEFVSEAVIVHLHDLSLRRFLRQHFNYGRGALVYHASLAGQDGERVELEPLRFYWDLIRYPQRLPKEQRVRFGSTLMFLSQVSNVLGYFVERFSPLKVRDKQDSSPEVVHSLEAPKTEAGQARLVAREAGGTWAANVIGIGCRYLAMLGATHILGGPLFGDYSLTLAITGLLSIVSVLGLSPGALPFLSRARQSGDSLEVRSVVRSAFLPVVLISLLLTVVVFFAAGWAGDALFDKPNLHRFLKPMSGLIALGAVAGMALTFVQGFMAVKQRVWIDSVLVTGVVALGMATSWALGFQVGGAVTATLLGATAGLGAGIVLLVRRVPGALNLSKPAAPLRVRALLGYSWPLMGTSMLAYLLLWTDVLFMGVYVDSEEVGVYAAAARIAAIAMLAHVSLGPVFTARLSDLHTTKDWPGIKHLYRMTARWAVWPGLALAWGLAIWGGDVLMLFGDGFRTGATALSVLCIGKGIASSTGMSGRVLGITGRARLNLMNMILLVGGNVVLNVLLIPRYGGLGAAAATSISLVLVRFLQVAQLRMFYGMLPWSLKSIYPIVGISALAALAYQSRAGFGGNWGWVLPFGVFLLACVVLFIATSLGEDDRTVLRALRGRFAGRSKGKQ